MPTEVFAEKVVAQILKPKPPAALILATNSRLLWISKFSSSSLPLSPSDSLILFIVAKFMPHWMTDWIFSSKYGLANLKKLLAAQKKSD